MATATESKAAGHRAASRIEEWYSPTQAAAVIGVRRNSVLNMIFDGRIDGGWKIGDGWLLPATAIRRIASEEQGGGPRRSPAAKQPSPYRLRKSDWLSVSDAAASAGLTAGRIRQLLLASEIRGQKVENRWLVYVGDIADLATEKP